MLKVGLTGGIGSGKTTVSNLFSNLKVPVIDTDVIARDLVNNEAAILNEIAMVFGDSVITENGSLDRGAMADIIFNDDSKKKQLEKILHPKIREQVKRQIDSIQNSQSNTAGTEKYCIIVIPLLFETDDFEINFKQQINRVLLITADKQTRIQRISERDNRSLNEIHSIIKTQISDEIKARKADDVLNNNGDIEALKSQVKQLHHRYRELAISAP